MVGQAWVYGDEVAVKGRVLRLSPLLNAAGIPNLFELTFAYNGYRTLERHNTMPHRATPLSPVGPLAVHPLWRSAQTRLLQMWERGTEDGSSWVVRSATTESTFFPLVGPDGRALDAQLPPRPHAGGALGELSDPALRVALDTEARLVQITKQEPGT